MKSMLSKIKNKRYYAKGNRSVVYTGFIGKKKVIIKKQKKNIAARDIAKIEARWLRILNKQGIGPKLISEGKDYIIMEFIMGKPIMDFLETAKKQDIEKVISRALKQCIVLDSLNITKKEMHKPVKHIIIHNNNPKFIDFERAKFSQKPKNLTQFCQFLTSKKVSVILRRKGIIINKTKLRKFLKGYKHS